MPKSCCVTFCSNNNLKNHDKKFYKLPDDEYKRKLWLIAINRAEISPNGNTQKLWSPKSKWVYVCSDHFISGERSLATNHPDYVPSIFPKKPIAACSATTPRDRKSKPSSPHRSYQQRLNRHTRRASYQSKKGLPRKFLLTSPSFESTESPSNTEIDSVMKEEESICDTSVCSKNIPVDDLDNSIGTFSLSSPISLSEREQIYNEIDNLRKERDQLKEKNMKLIRQSTALEFDNIIKNTNLCKMLTGLKPTVYKTLVAYLIKGYRATTKPPRLSVENQITLTIIKLKQNLIFDFLASLFGIGSTTAIDYFWYWVDVMYLKLKRLVRMQDRDQIFGNVPAVFKTKFPRLTSIIDCFEVFVEAPSSLKARAQFYSQYKKHTTIKIFISCTPLGAINFISQCWGGRASDTQIVKESGFHTSKYHMPGDQILADRGFTLQDEFAAGSSSELLVPAFTTGKLQLSAKEVETSRKIASVRIHIERVIGLLRNRYTILKGVLPLKIVKSLKDEVSGSILANCDKIVTVCAALANLHESIVFKV